MVFVANTGFVLVEQLLAYRALEPFTDSSVHLHAKAVGLVP